MAALNERPEPHISLDRVENIDIIRELVECCLCHGLVWYPVACKDCQKTFCSSCIQIVHEANAEPVCPQCSSPYIERPNPPAIIRLLGTVKVSCRYEPNGCKRILPYNELEIHEEICEYQLLLCSGCQQGIIKINLDQHESECRLVLITCDQCSTSYRREDKNFHTETECLRKQLKQLEIKLRDQEKKIDSMEQKLTQNDNQWTEFLMIIKEYKDIFQNQVQSIQCPGHNAEL